MSKTTIFGIVSLLAVGMILSSPLTAFAAVLQQPADYLDLEKTIVKIKQDPLTENNSITDVIYKVGGYVPEHDMVLPFGYGVITQVTNETGGTELNVIATTSHAGLLDADAQEDENDPILHNHYAVLGIDNNSPCGERPFIDALSEEEIGQVFVDGKTIIVKDLPPSALDSTNETEITPGTNIQFVASFLLEPVFDDENQDELIAVCVNPVDEQNDRTVIFGDEEQKPDYPRPDYGNNDRYGNDYQNGYGNDYSDGYSEYSSEYGNEYSDQHDNGYSQDNSYDEEDDDRESRD